MLLQNLTRVSGTLHEERRTFMILSRRVLLRMRNISDKRCPENQTHILRSVASFLKSRRL